jgi:hypothetical protein
MVMARAPFRALAAFWGHREDFPDGLVPDRPKVDLDARAGAGETEAEYLSRAGGEGEAVHRAQLSERLPYIAHFEHGNLLRKKAPASRPAPLSLRIRESYFLSSMLSGVMLPMAWT